VHGALRHGAVNEHSFIFHGTGRNVNPPQCVEAGFLRSDQLGITLPPRSIEPAIPGYRIAAIGSIVLSQSGRGPQPK
jgi:hypothetical protein